MSRLAPVLRLITCCSLLGLGFCCVSNRADAQLFSVDQLVNQSHAETWNTYLYPKRYIGSYRRQWLKEPDQQSKDWGELANEFWQVQVPIPDSAFAQGFFIHTGQSVAIFSSSRLQGIDKMSGFWGRYTAANAHLYIGLERNGLKDAWDRSYADLYVIAESESLLEEFSGLDVRMASPSESDSITSLAVSFLFEHTQEFGEVFWSYITSDEEKKMPESLDGVKKLIDCGFVVTVHRSDITADSVDDFILSTEIKNHAAYPFTDFTMIFESAGKKPQFLRGSGFEQVIRTDDSYLLLVRYVNEGWGWILYEGKGDGNLKSIFSAMDYST